MTVSKRHRVCFFALCLSSVGVVGGCSDDDSPPEIPDYSVDGGSSAPSEQSSSRAVTETHSVVDAGPSGATSLSDSTNDHVNSDGGSTEPLDPDAGDPSALGLLDGLRNDPQTSVFADLIERAEMQEDLIKEGPFTVFAPTNDAWSRLPEGYLDGLSRKQLETLVRNHLLAEPQSVDELLSSSTVVSLLEIEFTVEESDASQVYINGLTRLTARNRTFSGNAVHLVDSVLTVDGFPGNLVEAVHAYPRLAEFEERLTEGERSLLVQDGRTLFAPINGGFQRWDAQPVHDAGVSDGGAVNAGMALGYHILASKTDGQALRQHGVVRSSLGPYLGVSAGDDLTINDGQRNSRVLAELFVESGAEGSVLHIVEEQLIAPPAIDAVLASGTSAGDSFEQWRAAASETTVSGEAVSFSDYLGSAEDVTVFAPSDAAFNRIAGSFGDDLSKVLGLHVVSGVVDSVELAASANAALTTLSVSEVNTLRVVDTDLGLLLDGMVAVVTRDIPAANGVIHVVDAVLVPQDVEFPGETPQAVAAYPALSKMSTALAQSGLLDSGSSTLFVPHDSLIPDGIAAAALVESHALAPAALNRDTLELLGQQSLQTLAGGTITLDGDALTVDGFAIVRPDLLTQSGVVHIVAGMLGTAAGDAGAPDAGN